MADRRPKTFRGIPIDYRSQAQRENEEWEEFCRAEFANVPQEQLARPRYQARHFRLSADPQYLAFAETWANTNLRNSCMFLSAFGTAGKGRNETLRRHFQNRFARAARWWNGLQSRTLIALYQSLYPRRGKWKNVEDVPELVLCYAMCVAYLSQPPGKRSAVRARQTAREWMNRAIDAYERGLKPDL